ncbi:MAG: divalent-cation tolerance protein CutA [Chlamydiia bacterium]|nr:divalent-cation tolerance protein CutA [Chlamydiia bacterium]
MSEFVEMHWTTGSIEEARKVCRYLVQNRLAACAQILPWLESIYMWDNRLETTQESKVFIKTRRDRVQEIIKTIKDNTTYEVPEILVFDIKDGNSDYLEWMKQSTPEDLALNR